MRESLIASLSFFMGWNTHVYFARGNLLGASLAFVGGLFAIFIIVNTVAGAELVQCEAQPVTGDKAQWSYRTIDGRSCWYRGPKWKPKDELTWTTPDVQVERRPSDGAALPLAVVEAPPVLPVPSVVPPIEVAELTEDQLLASTCCWPELPDGHASEDEEVPSPSPPPRPRARPFMQGAALLTVMFLSLGATLMVLGFAVRLRQSKEV